MAELHVEAKKRTTPVWIWLVLAAVVVAVIIYFAARKKSDNSNTSERPNRTSYIQLPNERPVLSQNA